MKSTIAFFLLTLLWPSISLAAPMGGVTTNPCTIKNCDSKTQYCLPLGANSATCLNKTTESCTSKEECKMSEATMYECKNSLCYIDNTAFKNWNISENNACDLKEGGICFISVGITDDAEECKKKMSVDVGFKSHWDSKTRFCYLQKEAYLSYKATSDDWIQIYNEIKEPKLAINIPGLDFSAISTTLDDKGYIYIPYIGEYLTAAYKFAIVAASIVAVIMLIIIGAGIIVSGGGEQRVEGVKRIAKVFLGLAIAWGSYAILYNINPDLVQFKALKIQYIAPEELPDSIDKGEPGSATNLTISQQDINQANQQASTNDPASTKKITPDVNKTLSNTAYDEIFKKYGKLYNIDWRILKAVAYKESSLNASVNNWKSLKAAKGPEDGYIGLFQFKPNTCPGSIKSKCSPYTNLYDPDLNTHAGAIMLSGSLNKVKKYCPKADERTQLMLLYMSHNSGMGAVKCAVKKECNIETKKGTFTKMTTNGGCTLPEIKTGIVTFWNNHYKKIYVTNRGEKTYNYSLSTADTIIKAKAALPAN